MHLYTIGDMLVPIDLPADVQSIKKIADESNACSEVMSFA